MQYYFPSCNFAKMYPAEAEKLRRYLAQTLPVAGCCRVDHADRTRDTALYFCQACREVLAPKTNVRSLWEYLAEDTAFPWPDLHGETVLLQDCWRDREQPAIHRAVRSVLSNMNVDVREMTAAKENADFCGNLHFVPQSEENRALLERYPGKRLFELPEEEQAQLMREYTARLAPGMRVVTYCNRCTQGLLQGGADAVHLMALAASNL